MRNSFYLFLFGFLCLDVSAQTFRSPDILIDSKLDYNWSGVLVTKFRTLLKNYKITDPFVGRFPQKILLNELQVGNLLPTESKDLIRDFGTSVGLQFLNAETKVWIEDFSYDVKGFKTELKASEQKADGLVLGTAFSASNVGLRARKISLSLVIPGNNDLPLFNVDIINPVIQANEENLINFAANIKIQDNKSFYKLQILKANFDQMADGLTANTSDITFDYEKIVIPKVSLRLGNKLIVFSTEKIEKLIRDNHQAIKGLLLAQAADFLRTNTTKSAFKVLEQYKINKEYWLASPVLKSQIQLGKFASSSRGDDIQINLPGDFCTNQGFNELKQKCINHTITKTAPTRLNQQFHKKSVSVMKQLMAENDVNIVASISEDYVNKLLVTTYDAGLWKASLDEAGVELGPNKVIMRLNKKGDSGTLFMDVIYHPSKLEKLITGSKEIRFPLVLEVSLRIEKFDNEPVIIIRLNDVDTTDKTLIYGRPEENIISTLQYLPRFKNKVVQAIREKLSGLKSKDIIELRYPELKGLGLDKVDFLSDGSGRMNAIMRLEDLIEENTVN